MKDFKIKQIVCKIAVNELMHNSAKCAICGNRSFKQAEKTASYELTCTNCGANYKRSKTENCLITHDAIVYRG